MPFIFEQPNLDSPQEAHLYFDPGDGRLITVFCDESRPKKMQRLAQDPGHVHHLAFSISQVSFWQAVDRLDERKIKHSGPKDRGFMDSIYFRDPLGLLIELASYRFNPPTGSTHSNVLTVAHILRIKAERQPLKPAMLPTRLKKLLMRACNHFLMRVYPRISMRSADQRGIHSAIRANIGFHSTTISSCKIILVFV